MIWRWKFTLTGVKTHINKKNSHHLIPSWEQLVKPYHAGKGWKKVSPAIPGTAGETLPTLYKKRVKKIYTQIPQFPFEVKRKPYNSKR